VNFEELLTNYNFTKLKFNRNHYFRGTIKIHIMKYFLFLFSLSSSFAFGQLTQKSFRVEANGMFGTYGNSAYYGGSLGARWLVSERIGLRYNFDVLQLNNNTRHVHTPMGLVGGPILLASGIARTIDGDSTTRGGFGIVSGILLLILPEGLSYHLPIGSHLEISPYANVLGIDFIRDKNNNSSRVKYACSFGVQLTALTFSNLTVQGFVETRKAASVPWGFGAGVGLGWTFNRL
jgi:hypothetical protein